MRKTALNLVFNPQLAETDFDIGLITNPCLSSIDFIQEAFQQAGVNPEAESRCAEGALVDGKDSTKRHRRLSGILEYNATSPLIVGKKTMDIL